jgi:hypothetical protein
LEWFNTSAIFSVVRSRVLPRLLLRRQPVWQPLTIDEDLTSISINGSVASSRWLLWVGTFQRNVAEREGVDRTLRMRSGSLGESNRGFAALIANRGSRYLRMLPCALRQNEQAQHDETGDHC